VKWAGPLEQAQVHWIALTCVGPSRLLPPGASATAASCRRCPAAQASGGSSSTSGAGSLSRHRRGLQPFMDGEEAPLGALNLAEYAPAGARTVDCYRRIRKIGEGTYG